MAPQLRILMQVAPQNQSAGTHGDSQVRGPVGIWPRSSVDLLWLRSTMFMRGNPNSAVGLSLTLLLAYGILFLLLGSLIQPWCDAIYVPGLIVACYVLFGWCPRETCYFLRGGIRWVDPRERGSRCVQTGRRKGKGNCCWDVIYERIKNNDNNDKPLLARWGKIPILHYMKKGL